MRSRPSVDAFVLDCVAAVRRASCLRQPRPLAFVDPLVRRNVVLLSEPPGARNRTLLAGVGFKTCDVRGGGKGESTANVASV